MQTVAKPLFEARLMMAINGLAGHCRVLDGTARLLAGFGVRPLAAAGVYMAICSSRSWRRWGGIVTAIAAVVAVVVTHGLDRFLIRPRPFLGHPIALLLCIPDSVSVPSLEMAAAAALAFGVFAYGGKLRWLSLPYLILLGTSRVFCGIEYPMDQVWASTVGCAVVLLAIMVLNPRHLFFKAEGWPVGAVGCCVVVAAVFLCSKFPETSLPPQQSTFRSVTRVVGAEEKSPMRGMSPDLSAKVSGALAKLKLPGRIRRAKVGQGESAAVAGVKFDAGPDAKPMSRALMEKETLAIIRAAFASSPKVTEVDVFGVTTWDSEGRQMLTVVYSAAAQRKDAHFLFDKSAAKLTPSQAMSRFGLVFYRIHRGRE